jgi:3-oxoacyl-[acyl-carrier protein] reductase
MVGEGARVCITARKPDPLAAAVEELGGPEHAIAVAGRADDRDHQAEAIARTTNEFGPITMLVNNAGINVAFGPLMEIDPAAARKIFEVNALAPLSWIQQVYRAGMRESGGCIVNMSSAAGVNSAHGIAFYGATKAMLSQLTRDLAVELGPEIRVCAVAPAVVKTEFASVLYKEREELVAARYPLRRLGEATDVSGVVAFLLSDDAAWLTGQTVVVDGGLTLTGGLVP